MEPRELAVFAVASPYSWDVVASVGRSGLTAVCVDNLGGADPRLPLGSPAPSTPFVLGLASADGRRLAAAAALAAGFTEPRATVDPTAVVAPTVQIAHGVYVNAGVVVASNVVVGCHANLNRSSSIGHDCRHGFAVSIGPGAVLAGSVTVGDGAFVGAGATVLPGVAIGRSAIVGAGAVVTRDVADGAVVVGNPATELRRSDPGEDAGCPHCATR